MSGSGDELDLGQTIRGFNAGQKLFARYTLQKILGRGGMGVVWLAHDEKLEREVALKFLPELMVFDEQAVVDLKRETKKSQELRHHHIVSVYDFVSDEHSACIAMEYVDGPTLSALKARKENNCLEVEEIRPWIEQLCEALSYAHEKAKVVHRDLKPANLMVNGRGELKVTDFGIARSVSDSMSVLTMHRGTSGTLVYMSPQQINGERATPSDDIYSVGASIYELLTSKPPFYSGGIERQVQEKIPSSMAARRVEFSATGAEIPANWEKTIAACLAKDPAQRPQSAAAVASALGLKSTSYTTTPAVGLTASVASPRKRKMTPLLIGGAAALLVIAALGYYAWQRSRQTASQVVGTAQPQPTVSGVPAQPTASPQIATSETIPAASVAPVSAPSVAPVATGSISILTTPAGATVEASGQTGKTPASLTGIPVGKQILKIDRDGYERIEREVDVNQNETLSVTEPLERSRGSAEIKSTPQGIAFELIDIDGGNHKGKTPATIEKLPVGSAKLIFKPKDSANHEQVLVIAKGKLQAATWSPTTTPASSVPQSSTAKKADNSIASLSKERQRNLLALEEDTFRTNEWLIENETRNGFPRGREAVEGYKRDRIRLTREIAELRKALGIKK